MGFKVIPGASIEAHDELIGFINAYSAMQIGQEDKTLYYWTPDSSDAAQFADMEFNQFCGTFDPLKYFNIA